MDSTNTNTQLEFDPEVEAPMLGRGRDSMMGQPIFRGLDMLCPISTSSALAIAEQPELRAYKLGKQKCSYNQVELVIKDVGTGKPAELKVSEAIETCVGPEVDEQLRESCLKFNVRFVNNNRMYLYIYVVYATPCSTKTTDKHSVMYHWIPVTRSKCRKGCKGPVIRGLQRFGRMPRRNATTMDGEDSWKEPRHLYIAIDEASTHVCPRHETSKFRLLIAAYDDKNHLLGTTVSSSIRVLANNDAPLGAASFKLHCHIKGIIENASPPRSYITDEMSKQVELDRSILTDDKVAIHSTKTCFVQSRESESRENGQLPEYSSRLQIHSLGNGRLQDGTPRIGQKQEATFVTSDDNNLGVSYSTAHQVPYKKRKFDATSFSCCAEANECTSSRDPEVSPSRQEHDELPQDHDLGNRASTFDPLFHLFCFYSPERIFELQSQNPAFFFTYVKESRALYHTWCAQNAGPTLIRPVANVGTRQFTVSMIESGGPGIPYSISGHCPPGVFFSATKPHGSDLKMRLLKRRRSRSGSR